MTARALEAVECWKENSPRLHGGVVQLWLGINLLKILNGALRIMSETH